MMTSHALIDAIGRHLNWLTAHAPWPQTAWAPGVWWSQLEIATAKPASGERQPGVSKRCYRLIESPGGSNLYWDGPLMVAVRAAAGRLGEARWAAAADRYMRQYLAHGTSDTGLLWWGNHYYLSHDAATPVTFGESAAPVDAAHATAPLHETRPLPVAWELLAEVDREHTLVNLAAQQQHVHAEGPAAGFDRHANGSAQHPFLEAGAMLVLSQAWRAKLAGAPDAIDVADGVLRYSVGQRDPATGLLPVSPGSNRWDQTQTTSELGLWAGAALEAAAMCGRSDWREMALDALAAWCEQAWVEDRGRFAGRLDIRNGRPIDTPQTTIYQPGHFADPWQPLFPTHDYPMPAAEACLSAWELTGDGRFETATRRWVDVLGQTLPARNGLGGYAEHYGRAIHLLWRAGRTFDDAALVDLAWAVAVESLAVLDAGPCLRTHPWEDRVEAVDGAGWLLLAWLTLVDDEQPPMLGLIW